MVNLTSLANSLGQECQPFDMTPPDSALFDPTKVVIVSNGRFVIASVYKAYASFNDLLSYQMRKLVFALFRQ